jgi:hypothetical protein
MVLDPATSPNFAEYEAEEIVRALYAVQREVMTG